jgi:phosphopantothenoylcysteine decarboxylase/phosphopantothenate--cysteine ligase
MGLCPTIALTTPDLSRQPGIGMAELQGREILIGVSGGIAAYKTAGLVSQLVQAGAGVSVVMTESAGKFIGAATFAALTGRRVATSMFDELADPLGEHITAAQRAQLICVAPATANFLAKAACGLADDLLSTLMLSFSGPILLAPAMNTQMWDAAAVQRNVATLRGDGRQIIDPEEGWLSCRQRGAGRMANIETIRQAIEKALD